MLVSNEFMLEYVTLHMIFPVVYFWVGLLLHEVKRTVSGAFLSDIDLEIWSLIFFNLARFSSMLFFSSFFNPHISPPLRGGMILLYSLVGGGETYYSSRLG